MLLGPGARKSYTFARCESRIPMEVGVRIDGHPLSPGVETTFTDNVSSHGVCVRSSRKWQVGDRITVSTLTGDFHSIARVAYCEPLPDSGYMVGIEFVDSGGPWVVEKATPE